MGKVTELSLAREKRLPSARPEKVKLTKRLVESVSPGSDDIWLWDRELPGFGLRAKPSGIKTFVVQYRNRAGRTRRLAIGRHGVITPDEARRRAKARLAEVQGGRDPSAERQAERRAQRVNELCDRYLSEHAYVHKKPSSAREDRRLIESRVRPALGAIKIEALRRTEVIKLHDSLRTTPYEANRTLSLLNKMCNLAEVWQLRPEGSNPCRLVRRFREKERKRFLTEAELARLGEVLTDEARIGRTSEGAILAIRLLALTGCRLGEILNLRWEHIDLEGGSVHLPDAKAGERTVPLGAAAVNLLRSESGRGDYVVSGGDPACPISRSTVESAWRSLRSKANLDARIHDLRHTVGTYAGQSGVNAFLVRDLLGHKTLAVTGRYVAPDLNPLKGLADQVSERIATALLAR